MALNAWIHPASALGAAWLLARRRHYRRHAAPLTPAETTSLTPWFDAPLLESVRVAHVHTIHNPLPARLRPAGMLDLSTVHAMAFIDTVVIASANQHPHDDPRSLLFHELVHVAQFRLLGVRPFVAAYLRDWLDAGRSYVNNPLEAMAFELQARYDAHDVFNVLDEVRSRLALTGTR